MPKVDIIQHMSMNNVHRAKRVKSVCTRLVTTVTRVVEFLNMQDSLTNP